MSSTVKRVGSLTLISIVTVLASSLNYLHNTLSKRHNSHRNGMPCSSIYRVKSSFDLEKQKIFNFFSTTATLELASANVLASHFNNRVFKIRYSPRLSILLLFSYFLLHFILCSFYFNNSVGSLKAHFLRQHSLVHVCKQITTSGLGVSTHIPNRRKNATQAETSKKIKFAHHRLSQKKTKVLKEQNALSL